MLVKDAARIAAEETLNNYWDGEFPVDPVAIARAKNLDVRFAVLKDGVSGAIVAETGKAPIILVDSTENYGRQMFTTAHEIGHYVEREKAGDTEYSFVETRSRKYDLREFYADEFAGNLLMPESAFRIKYKDTGSQFLTASHFAVSVQAVKKRLERLGIA